MSPLTSLVFYQDLSGATVTTGKSLTHASEKGLEWWGRLHPRLSAHTRVLGLQKKSCVGYSGLLALIEQ